MKKNIIAVSVLCFFSVTYVSAAKAERIPDGYQLKQVLLMSRHNLRAPLVNNGSVLEQSTPEKWPEWDVQGGQLTTKGGVLEVQMGHYLNEWLSTRGILKAGECPAEGTVYIYANSLQRTVATAQFFANGAFPGCDIQVHHQSKMGFMDPVFNPVITDNSPSFGQQATAAMEKKRKEFTLKENYQLLENIIRYNNSPACKEKKICSLAEGNDVFIAEAQREPGVTGSLKVGNALVDAFTLQYYEGFPMNQVAWGRIKTSEEWKQLAALKNGYQDSLFTSPDVARNVAAPLINYIADKLVNNFEKSPAVTVMVGHDSNIASLLTALNVKPYQLHGQNERTPVGGKIMFQRWHDSNRNRDLMKMEYIYQSSEQLRNTETLSLRSPAQHVTLELKDCPVDENGFCNIERFNKVISGIVTIQ